MADMVACLIVVEMLQILHFFLGVDEMSSQLKLPGVRFPKLLFSSLR